MPIFISGTDYREDEMTLEPPKPAVCGARGRGQVGRIEHISHGVILPAGWGLFELVIRIKQEP